MLVVNELFIEIYKNHPLSSAQLRFWPSVQYIDVISSGCNSNLICFFSFVMTNDWPCFESKGNSQTADLPQTSRLELFSS